MIVFIMIFSSVKTNALFYEINYCCKDKKFTVALKNSKDASLANTNTFTIGLRNDKYNKDFKISGEIDEKSEVRKKIGELMANISWQDYPMSSRYQELMDELDEVSSDESEKEREQGDYYERRNLELMAKASEAMKKDKVAINIENKIRYYKKQILDLILKFSNLGPVNTK